MVNMNEASRKAIFAEIERKKKEKEDQLKMTKKLKEVIK